jgi:hypothetical protein
MTRPPALPRNQPSRRSGSEALAAMLGHQLNNIAVPLDGFAELALLNLSAPELARHDLAEMRIAIGRIKELALELESLGEFESLPKRVTIGACMTAPPAGSITAPWTVEWLCSASTPVAVDLLHAQRAILSLARVATPHITASLELPAGARCITCGAVFARTHKGVCIESQSLRPLDGQSLRNPFGAAASGGGRSLTLAVLVHCAHLAGGHVLLDEPSRRLSLAFSCA